MIAKEDRQSAIVFVDEGVSKGVRRHKACKILEIDARAVGEKRIEAPIHCGSTSSLGGEPNASE